MYQLPGLQLQPSLPRSIFDIPWSRRLCRTVWYLSRKKAQLYERTMLNMMCGWVYCTAFIYTLQRLYILYSVYIYSTAFIYTLQRLYILHSVYIYSTAFIYTVQRLYILYRVYLKNLFPWRTERDIAEALTPSSKVPDILSYSDKACISQTIGTVSQTQLHVVTVVLFPLYVLIFMDGTSTGVSVVFGTVTNGR
jgi:hypothetical protein